MSRKKKPVKVKRHKRRKPSGGFTTVKSHKRWIKRTSKRSSLKDEKEDYQKLFRSRLIRERNKYQGEEGIPERYKMFRLPTKNKVKKAKLKYSELPQVKPIEVLVNGQKKVVDFKRSSWGAGGVCFPETKEIQIAKFLQDEVDWTMRKGTIAHELQHLASPGDQLTPTAVNNILRQLLLQGEPGDEVVLVGTWAELKALASRYGRKIRRRFISTATGEKAILYYLRYKKKRYQFAKDAVFLPLETMKRIARKHKRRLKTGRVEGTSYKKLVFRFANIYNEGLERQVDPINIEEV